MSFVITCTSNTCRARYTLTLDEMMFPIKGIKKRKSTKKGGHARLYCSCGHRMKVHENVNS